MILSYLYLQLTLAIECMSFIPLIRMYELVYISAPRSKDCSQIAIECVAFCGVFSLSDVYIRLLEMLIRLKRF